jgi:hypothetical protein
MQAQGFGGRNVTRGPTVTAARKGKRNILPPHTADCFVHFCVVTGVCGAIASVSEWLGEWRLAYCQHQQAALGGSRCRAGCWIKQPRYGSLSSAAPSLSLPPCSSLSHVSPPSLLWLLHCACWVVLTVVLSCRDNICVLLSCCAVL